MRENSFANLRLGKEVATVYKNGTGFAKIYLFLGIIIGGISLLLTEKLDSVVFWILVCCESIMLGSSIWAFINSKNEFVIHEKGCRLRTRSGIEYFDYEDIEAIVYKRAPRVATGIIQKLKFVDVPYLVLKNGEERKLDIERTAYLDNLLNNYMDMYL